MIHSNFKILIILIFSLIPVSGAMAHHCLGGHAGDPECLPSGGGGAAAYTAIIDRPNNQMIFIGTDLSATTTVDIGGTPLTSVSSNVSETELYVAFDSDFSSAVQRAGTYIVAVDSNVFFVYIDGAIPNATSSTCPCETSWDIQFANPGGTLVNTNATSACALVGNEFNSSFLPNLGAMPTYLVGTLFDASGTQNSVCRTIEVSPGISDITLLPVTSAQHAACIEVMEDNSVICQ